MHFGIGFKLNIGKLTRRGKPGAVPAFVVRQCHGVRFFVHFAATKPILPAVVIPIGDKQVASGAKTNESCVDLPQWIVKWIPPGNLKIKDFRPEISRNFEDTL